MTPARPFVGRHSNDQDGERGAAVCDVEVSAKDLVIAGMTGVSKTMGQGLAAVYGRAHDSVTDLYTVMRSGERVAWPIHYDPRNQERYFAVIADGQQLKDIVAVAGRRRTPLKEKLRDLVSRRSVRSQPPSSTGPLILDRAYQAIGKLATVR